jgi:hypothetical protein
MGPTVNFYKDVPSDATLAAAFAGAIPVALVEPTPVGELVVVGMYVYLWWVTGGIDPQPINIEIVGSPADISNWAAQKEAELTADPYLIAMDPAIPLASEGEMFPVDWNMWPPAYMSIRHPESAALIAGALMRADQNRILNSNSPLCISGGQVCIFAAYTLPATPGFFEGHVAILVVSGKHTYFLVLNGTFRNTLPGVGEGQWVHVTDNVYYDKSTLFYKCAWWMASRTSNGHGMVPEQFWLDSGTAWNQWEVIRARYGFVIPIASVQLPVNPFK